MSEDPKIEKTKVQKKEGLEYKPWSGLAWQRLTVFCLILLVAISLGIIVSEDSSATVAYLIMLILAGIFLLGLWLLTQRWFWIITLSLSTLASAFACIASIIYFQILGAVGFFVLAFVLFAITSAIADS